MSDGPQIRIPTSVKITVRVEGDRILLLADGKMMLSVPYEAAVEIAQAMMRKAVEAKLHADVARAGLKGLAKIFKS